MVKEKPPRQVLSLVGNKKQKQVTRAPTIAERRLTPWKWTEKELKDKVMGSQDAGKSG